MAETSGTRNAAPGRSGESRVWAAILQGFLRGAPTQVMRIVRRRMPAAPIEEFVFIGRRTGKERRMLLGLFDVDGRWYVGSPNGTSGWVRNLQATGECVVIRRDGVPRRVRATELRPGDERDSVIAATGRQPAPAGNVYRGARAHISAVGRYFRLEPLEVPDVAVAATPAGR